MSIPPEPSAAATFAFYNVQRQCMICGEDGTLVVGLRCAQCDLYFHYVCIDPLKYACGVPTEGVQQGNGIVHVCDDCADQLEDEEAEDTEEGQEPLLIPGGAVESDDSDDDSDDTADSDDSLNDFIVEDELDDEKSASVAQLVAGERVWTRSECDCETCIDINHSVDTWDATRQGVENDTSRTGIMARALVAAIESRAHVIDEHIADLLFRANKPTLTTRDIDKQGFF